LVYNVNMKKSISVLRKKRGRPATGTDPLVAFRAPVEMTAAIDAAAKAEGVTRTEVLRRAVREWLVKHGFLQREGGG
jgi:hypothetical protein